MGAYFVLFNQLKNFSNVPHIIKISMSQQAVLRRLDNTGSKVMKKLWDSFGAHMQHCF